jgi:hypothetical protein
MAGLTEDGRDTLVVAVAAANLDALCIFLTDAGSWRHLRQTRSRVRRRPA